MLELRSSMIRLIIGVTSEFVFSLPGTTPNPKAHEKENKNETK